MLSMHIDRLGLFSHFYGSLFNFTTCQGCYASATAICIEVGRRCTIAMSAQCSAYQLPGCECSVKRSCTPLRCLNAAYMCIYSHMQPYIHAFECIHEFQTYICIIINLSIWLFMLLCFYVHIYMCIQVYSGLHLVLFYIILQCPVGQTSPS